jgi:hypothetical protein
MDKKGFHAFGDWAVARIAELEAEVERLTKRVQILQHERDQCVKNNIGLQNGIEKLEAENAAMRTSIELCSGSCRLPDFQEIPRPGGPPAIRAVEGLDDCTHYEGKCEYALVDKAQYEAMRAEVEQLRGTIKLMVGRDLSIPWRKIGDAVVNEWVEEFKRVAYLT